MAFLFGRAIQASTYPQRLQSTAPVGGWHSDQLVPPGETVSFLMNATDPEGDPVQVRQSANAS